MLLFVVLINDPSFLLSSRQKQFSSLRWFQASICFSLVAEFHLKCWFHTFQAVFSCFYGSTNPSWSLRLSCQLFSNRCASLQVDPIIFNIRKINSKFSQWCLLQPSQVVFVIPALPPFFFKDSDFLIKYPFYSCEVSSSFSFKFRSGDLSWRY